MPATQRNEEEAMTATPTCTPEIQHFTNELGDGYSVVFRWTGVDRPVTHSIGTGKNRRLAERLAAAVTSGAVFASAPEVRRDVYGATYVEVRLHVMGRHLNADLRRLGY
jgi:hypothetical protein